MFEQNKSMRLGVRSLALVVCATLSGWALSVSAQPALSGPPPGGLPPGGMPAGGPPPGVMPPGGMPPGGMPGAFGAAKTPAKAQAPFDPSGYWVALVTQDWRYRMVVPGPGQYSGIPISLAGKQFADSWKAADAIAAGKACTAYGAPALMMAPTRLHITWQDDNTLRVETDAGQQTRLLHFNDTPPGAPSLQGTSKAQWLTPPAVMSFGGGGPGSAPPGAPPAPKYGVLRVSTNNLLAGLLRKNGAPYSDKTTLQEDWMLNALPGGGDYLTISAVIKDPVYLRGDYYVAPVFVRESDASKWQPAPCTLTAAR